jgi:hypothetical protein
VSAGIAATRLALAEPVTGDDELAVWAAAQGAATATTPGG